MWRRYLVSFLLVCASLFLLGGVPGGAAAQDRGPTYFSSMERPAGLDDVAALFKRTTVPVRLYELDGPDTLAVGEEGRFAAFANIDVATLPLRIRWDFGDGSMASSLHARHRFSAPGTYAVTFSFSNSVSEATDTLHVRVIPPAVDAALTASQASVGEDGVHRPR